MTLSKLPHLPTAEQQHKLQTVQVLMYKACVGRVHTGIQVKETASLPSATCPYNTPWNTLWIALSRRHRMPQFVRCAVWCGRCAAMRHGCTPGQRCTAPPLPSSPADHTHRAHPATVLYMSSRGRGVSLVDE